MSRLQCGMQLMYCHKHLLQSMFLFVNEIHPLLPTVPSLAADTVGVPQPSVAVAVPSAPLISPEVGLQPSVVVVPPVVITGAVLSAVQVTVRDAVDVLPQASLAVHVLVCVRDTSIASNSTITSCRYSRCATTISCSSST